VVVVPFPYSERLAEKRRPAVIVSTPELATSFGLVWLAMITSADNAGWPCDVAVSDLRIAGLPAPSMIRPVKVATVDVTRIVRRIGRLPVKDARAVAAGLRNYLP
jgi:mRNA interferase MazF